MTQTEAEQKLDAAGLGADFEEAYSETVPEGQVIQTDPSAGSRILDDGTVTVTMSLGAERYQVPKVKGMSEDRAQDALLERKLSFDESIPRYSEKIPEGTVIGSDPPVGTILRPGASVDLIVSKGRRPITVGENWVGKSVDEMTAQLEGKGLVVDVVAEEFSDTIDEGDVISYQPDSGTLFRGEKVEVTVSQGPELIEVPSVRRLRRRRRHRRARGRRLRGRHRGQTRPTSASCSVSDPGRGDWRLAAAPSPSTSSDHLAV